MSGPGHPREADVPKQINTPNPGQALVKLFSLKGRFQPVLDETIVPVVVVPSEQSSARKLAAWGTSQGASGAGNQNIVLVRNAPESGVLAVITKMWFLSGAAGDTCEVQVVAAAGGVGVSEWRDSRQSGSPVIRFTTNAVASAVLSFPQYEATGILTHDTEWVIGPGFELFIRQGGINTTLRTMLEWYEVPLAGGQEL
jgi:hypothetical protein